MDDDAPVDEVPAEVVHSPLPVSSSPFSAAAIDWSQISDDANYYIAGAHSR